MGQFIRADLGTILSYQFPSSDGDVIVGVGFLGLTLIQMPPNLAAHGAVLQSSDVIDAIIDADTELSKRHRRMLRQNELEWLEPYLKELKDEIALEEKLYLPVTLDDHRLSIFDAISYGLPTGDMGF